MDYSTYSSACQHKTLNFQRYVITFPERNKKIGEKRDILQQSFLEKFKNTVCKDEKGNEIVVRTAVLKDAEGNLRPYHLGHFFIAIDTEAFMGAEAFKILLREIDPEFKSPVSDNLVYQNFPAIVFGFPLMLLATLAPVKPILTLIILVGFFAVMNVLLFRSYIFKSNKKKQKS